jgi:ketosteroid isomerase-like protein
MRNVTFALAFLVAGAAFADKGEGKGEGSKGGDKAKDAAAAAKATLDKFDEAWNAHDAKAAAAFLDKSFFGAGPFASAKMTDIEAGKAQLEKDAASGARIMRNGIVIKADESGDTAWFIGDYMFSPKVPPGALPVRRPMRVTGVLVHRGKDWKISMVNMSSVTPDPPPPVQNQPMAPTATPK